MKCSICIPQYNRIQYLLKNLSIIEKQTYSNIEIVISDDHSNDDTESQILNLGKTYRYPILFSKSEKNQGYDRNLRRSLELATGDYCIVLGNDDSLYLANGIELMVDFLQANNYPEIGFCNFVEENNMQETVKRAAETKILGTGPQVALRYYSGFSFVGGIVFKKSTFDAFNTADFDGSVYAQIALSCTIISAGNQLFSISEPIVLKDIYIDGKFSNSYLDKIAKTWKNFRTTDGGLKSVINVLCTVFTNTHTMTMPLLNKVFGKIYKTTLPFWILDYKHNKALPEACGIFLGMKPWTVKQFNDLNFAGKLRVLFYYFGFSAGAFIMPARLFFKYKNRIYAFLKK